MDSDQHARLMEMLEAIGVAICDLADAVRENTASRSDGEASEVNEEEL